jgi:hypothetical protein
MGDVIHGPWWGTLADTAVDRIETDIEFPRGLEKLAPASAVPLPAHGFADGDRVWDRITGQRGTIRGRMWGDQPIGIGRPLKYAVLWDEPQMVEAVVACRLIPARPVLAPRPSGEASLTTLHLRRSSLRPASWWPGKSSGGPSDDGPKGAA